MRIWGWSISVWMLFLQACGPENAAKEVCACYHEVYQLDDSAANEKIKECMFLLEQHRDKYKDEDDKNEFEKALHRCR